MGEGSEEVLQALTMYIQAQGNPGQVAVLIKRCHISNTQSRFQRSRWLASIW